MDSGYRGRLAPSPTGYLHVGHARTFWTAQERCRAAGGILILRNEDLDPARSQPEFAAAMMEDLRWFGFSWQEGPDCGGPCAPYSQSQRLDRYRATLQQLQTIGAIYRCECSRQDVLRAVQAPHAADDEPIYPGTCRDKKWSTVNKPTHWRFRVPDGEVIEFADGGMGSQRFTSGQDFGDFVVWRHDDVPSYQLAVVTDDAEMRVTEVVRGTDLLISTARQLLLYRALGWPAPAFYHCPLVTNAAGARLAKRDAALSLRALREQGRTPEFIRATWQPFS